MVRAAALLLAAGCLACLMAAPSSARCLRGSRGVRVAGRGPNRRVARQAAQPGEPKYDAAFVTQYLATTYEREASAACNRAITAEWEYITDLTNTTKEEIYVRRPPAL